MGIEDDITTIKMIVRSILEHQASMEMKLNQLISDSQPKDRQEKEKAIKTALGSPDITGYHTVKG